VAQHTERFRVRWIDTDAGGRIHFTAAFRWVEAAETELFRTLGLFDEWGGEFPRRQVEAEFFRMLVFDDEIELTIRVENVGRSSIRFAWEARHDGEIAMSGGYTIVRVGEDGRPASVEEHMRSLLVS
jgi:YbgC/YbaW family acyl-CoA thioester hydrolase